MSPVATYAKAALVTVLALFAPVGEMVLAVAVLTTLDLVLGLIAAKREGKKLTLSYGFRRTVAKSFLFQTAILATYYVEVTFKIPLPITSVVAGTIALAELFSCLENISRMTGLDLKSAVSAVTGKPSEKHLLTPAVPETSTDNKTRES